MVSGSIRQVIVLYSNGCCMAFAWVDSALVDLDEWSSYGGIRLTGCLPNQGNQGKIRKSGFPEKSWKNQGNLLKFLDN